MFSCPNCLRVVGEYPNAGVLALVCANCTFKYEISGGVVRSFSSRVVQLRAATEGPRAASARLYELVIAISPRETLRFTFGTERDDEWIRIATGDQCVVVYSMRFERREELLFIVNRTSSERFILGKPGERTRYRSILYGSATAIIAGVGAAALSLPVVAVAGIAALAGFATAKGLVYVLEPKHALGSNELVALNAQQEMLGQKRTLLQLREDVLAEIEVRRALRRRLGDLRSRMAAVRLDAYAVRIDTIDRALTTLDAQLAVDTQLVTEYERALQIVDIEYESIVAAAAMPADANSIMESRLADLRAAEELRAETTRRLAANAEVEALLRTHSG